MLAKIRNELLEKLQKDKIISHEIACNAHTWATEQKSSVVHYLASHRMVSVQLLAEYSAQLSGLPLAHIENNHISIKDSVINFSLLKKIRALPLELKEKSLCVGISDPEQISLLQPLQFSTGLQIEPFIIDDNQLEEGLKKLSQQHLDSSIEVDPSKSIKKSAADFDQLIHDSDEPAIQFINHILQNAIRQGASDLHFEPQENSYRIRQRCDGILSIIAEPDLSLAAIVNVRLKVIAGLDIAEKRKPQDGRTRINFAGLPIVDARINCLPTLWGEKIAIRLLNPRAARLSIKELGLEPDQEDLYTEALSKPQGLILVTGPTGSGKTVSLYSALDFLNNTQRNISTVEDPVEINLPGINQVNINPKQGLFFSDVLRAFLRQDPDILMVGEIRDRETAEIAIRAAQTGHLVLSTLHTNSATETITRLCNMGIPKIDIATSIILIVSQRLVRKCCSQCANKKNLLQGLQCNNCQQGYKGRIAVHEVVSINNKIKSMILSDLDIISIEKCIREEGFYSLKTAGLRKISSGLTTLSEINNVTRENV